MPRRCSNGICSAEATAATPSRRAGAPQAAAVPLPTALPCTHPDIPPREASAGQQDPVAPLLPRWRRRCAGRHPWSHRSRVDPPPASKGKAGSRHDVPGGMSTRSVDSRVDTGTAIHSARSHHASIGRARVQPGPGGRGTPGLGLLFVVSRCPCPLARHIDPPGLPGPPRGIHPDRDPGSPWGSPRRRTRTSGVAPCFRHRGEGRSRAARCSSSLRSADRPRPGRSGAGRSPPGRHRYNR